MKRRITNIWLSTSTSDLTDLMCCVNRSSLNVGDPAYQMYYKPTMASAKRIRAAIVGHLQSVSIGQHSISVFVKVR